MTPPRLGVWPTLPLGVYGRHPVDELPFPLGDPRCSLYARARHGLHHGVRALGLGAGDEILMPAYHHGSEVEALIRAGLVPVYYDATATLAPDERELDAILSPRTRALYLTHYLGVPQDAPRWRAWCDARELLLVEDAAQAWLARVGDAPAGSFGDLAIFCLYKTYGLPDGAALVVDGDVGERGHGDARAKGILRRHASWLAARSSAVSTAGIRMQRTSVYDPEADFALGDPGAGPTSALEFLLARLAPEDASPRRRAHYEELLESLRDFVPPAFQRLPPGASPFAFPVETDRKPELLARLDAGGIGGLDFWSVAHPTLRPAEFPRATALRGRLVGLPVHQDLRPGDVARIAEVTNGATRPRRLPDTIERVGSLEELRPDWERLAPATGNIFSTWEWASVWWRHFGEGNELRLAACRGGDGRRFAVLPLQRSGERPLRTLRFIGHSHGDHLGPICSPADRPRSAAALRRMVREERADVFLGDKMPAVEGWPAFLGGRVLRRAGSPIMRFHGASWDELLRDRSANFREQVRRRERKLRREHEVTIRLSDAPERLEADLDTLFALNAARWPGDRWFAGATEAFHRDFARVALDRGWLRLWILEADGAPVAAWYGFRFGGAESYYQAGRDPAWDRRSVGFVLLAHTVRAAVEDGMSEYRFLEGGESYKYRFANSDPGLETITVARTAAGAAAVAAAFALGRQPAFAALGRRIAA